MSTIASGTTVNSGIVFGTTESSGVVTSPLIIETNAGVEVASGVAIYGANTQAWTLANYGTIDTTATSGVSVDLHGGGSVYNTGLIAGYSGLYIYNAAGTLSNAGTIAGTGGWGVYFGAGGSVVNTGTGLIQGTRYAIDIAYAPGTVSNAGTIDETGTSGFGADLAIGGSVANTGTGLIEGYGAGVYIHGDTGAVTNAATILGTGGFGYGVRLGGGGSVDNTGTGLIEGYRGVRIDAAGTVTNAATIGGSREGVLLLAGGVVANTGTGLIAGGVRGVYILGSAGRVTNAGTILGTSGFGVRLAAGGTVVDSGTISGAGGPAISFGGTGGNRLELLPGYVFGGSVVAAGTANALELGSAATAGTLSGIGSAFTNFATVTVDAGAQWTLGGTNAIGAGVTLDDLGSLTNLGSLTGSGSLVVDPASLANSGYIGLGVTLSGGGYLDNAASGTIAATGTAVLGTGGAATVVNAGKISGLANFSVYLGAGGFLTNGASASTGASIAGGVGIGGGTLTSGTVVNFATIDGGPNGGVAFFTNDRLTNAAGAVIAGSFGIGQGESATYSYLTNLGTIIGRSGSGAYFDSPGSISNAASGLIAGATKGISALGLGIAVDNAGTIIGTAGIGVYLAAGGTVVDAGTITGGNSTAVYFGGTGGNLLALENGYSLSGVVIGSTAVGASNTIELLGTVSAAVTVNYSGVSLTNFTDLLFGNGGYGRLDISSTGTVPITLAGFTLTSDVIDLTQIGTSASYSINDANKTMSIIGSKASVTLQLDSTEENGAQFILQNDGSGGTDLTPVCYCRGTRILTPDGEVAVEELAIGDRVATISGAAQPVKWIGQRAYDGRFVAGNKAVLPVRIAAGALAAGVPARDLFVSPGHALYLDGVLVRAEHLVNGATIVQEERVERLEYFHIELEAHDIIYADGAAAESYTDCGNRAKFHNAADFARLYPDDDRPRWQYCAPLVEWESAEADAIRAALLERAAALGHRLDRDPDLHLVVDGVAVRPAAADGCLYRFHIPAGSAAVALASRSVAPAEVEAAARDLRRLGVPIERVVLSDADLRIEAAHGHAGLADGFHADEPTHRWTDGLAPLPDNWLRAFPGALTLEVHLFPSGLGYRRGAETAPARVRDTKSVVA